MIKAETPIIIDKRELTQWDELASGELLLSLRPEDAEETDRLVLGLDEDYGNPNFDRQVTPFAANELLTEGSPRVRELFSQTIRNQDRHAFFVPTQVRYHPTEWVEAKSARHDGGYAFPILLKDKALATKIDYQAFIDGQPARTGTLRILAGPGTVICKDSWGIDFDEPEIEFKVERDGNDFVLLAKCLKDVNLTLLVRMNRNAPPPERVAENQPPVWETGADLGTIVGPVTLVANDPEGYAVTYTSFDLPSGLVLNTDTGELTPVGFKGQTIFTVDASDGVLQTRRVFSVFVNSAPVWITPAGSLGLYETGKPVVIQLEASDIDNDVLTYSLVSPLPTGLTMNAAGRITGVASGDGTFTVRVSDGTTQVDRTFSFASNAPPIWVTPSGSIGRWNIGSSVSYQFSATDPDNDPITFAMTPGFTLPTGLTLSSSGLLSGSAQAGKTFSVRVSDTNGAFADRSFTVQTNTAPVWQTGADDIGPFAVGSMVDYQLVAVDNDNDPITYQRRVGFPPRNTVISSSGRLTGGPILPQTPEYLEFPISANTLVEVYVNGVQTTNFLVNGQPYNPPISTGSSWAKVEPLNVTAPPVPFDDSYLVTYGSDTYFRSKPYESPFITDGNTFVPEIGKTYTITYTARKVVKETNGIDSCFRPAFDANRLSDGVQDNAMGTKYGFEMTQNDLISTTNWVLNQFYTVSATWTPTIAYSQARGRLRVNRISGNDDVNNPPPYSDAIFEIKAAEISEGTQRPKSTVFVPAPNEDATVRVVTRAISNPAAIVDEHVHEHKPVITTVNAFSVRANDPLDAYDDRTFVVNTFAPDLSPGEAYIVENTTEYNLATAPGDAPPSQEEIFNSWARFDGDNYYPTGTPPGGQATGWTYSNGTIKSTVNSGQMIGFVSPDTRESYTHTVTLSSTNSDDDAIAIIIAFALVNGVPNSLVAWRAQGGLGQDWSISHMAGTSLTNLAIGSSSAPNNQAGWGGAGGSPSKVQVIRDGNVVKVRCSQFGSTALDPATELTYIIPAGSIFAGPTPYGYAAMSQADATFSDIAMTGGLDESVVYDARSLPPKVVVYNFQTNSWEEDLSRSIYRDQGYPRNLTNPKTGKTYRLDGPRPYSLVKIAEPPARQWLFNYDDTQMTRIKAALGRLKSNTNDATILFIGDSTTYGGGAGNDPNPVVNSYVNAYPAKAASRITSVPVSIDSRAGDGASGAKVGNFVPMHQYDNTLIVIDKFEPAPGSTVGGFIFQAMEDQATMAIRPRKSWDVFEFSYIQGTQPTTNFSLGSMRLVTGDNVDVTLNAAVEPFGAKTIEFNRVGSSDLVVAVAQLAAGQTFYTLGWKFKSSQEKRLHFVNGGARGWNSGTSGTVPIGYTREGAGQTWVTLNAIQGVWKPDLTFINLGINDYRSGGLGITPAQYKANIQKIIDRAKISGDVVLCVPNNIAPAAEGSIPSDQFHQALYELALANNVPLIDFSVVLGTHAESMANGTQRDDLHPNQAGYDMMGEAAANLISDLVDKS